MEKIVDGSVYRRCGCRDATTGRQLNGRGAYCVLAHDAVRLLCSRGLWAKRLADGMLEWRLADLPVVT